ncbi:MAG: amidohydrolase family protein, partial [Planctomycetota bacterium]|nr:amidohydrolase family protein [Planctomycetota bacterium]
MFTALLVPFALAGLTAVAPAPAAGVVAIRAGKALTCAESGPAAIADPVILVRDGRILAIGSEDEVEVPEGAEVVDYGERWVVPGFIDLHSHVGGSRGDI